MRRALLAAAVLIATLSTLPAWGTLAPPQNITPPKIRGLPQVGALLKATRGTWTGSPSSFSFRWKRCNALGRNCRVISGATAKTYAVGAADLGHALRVSVTAYNAAGASFPARSAPSEPVQEAEAGGVSHYEYVFNDGPVSVYDIDNGFKLVETFTLPGTTRGVRGVAVSPATHMMFVSFGGDGGVYGTGSVLAYDLVSRTVVWSVNLATGIDSGAVSSDGKLLYMPDGENSTNGNWYILDTATGAVVGKIATAGTGPHDGVMSADGRILQLGDRNYSRLTIFDTGTASIRAQIGPLVGGVRPNTINGSDSLSFTTATGFDGFQIESITQPENPVLYTESFATCLGPFSTCSHGISLSPDNREVAVIDAVHKAVQFWDVHGAGQGVAPTRIASVPVHGLEGEQSGCAYDCGRSGWLQHTLDGRYVFVGDSGDVIDTATHKVVATVDNLLNTRQFVEIDWSAGVPIASSGRQGIGY